LVSAARATGINRQSNGAQPHPILSDLRLRQALAYCTDKLGLVTAAYPDLNPVEREALIIDSFIPPSSWAYTPPTTTYTYSPTLAGDLLNDAGWIWPDGEDYRMKDGRELVISLKTTDSQLRIDVVAAYTTQLAACGIRLIGENLPISYFLGGPVLYSRDFSIAEFGWMGDVNEPGGYNFYGCNAIPSPANGWSAGQNYMGWCNPDSETALISATNTSLPQDVRKAYYAQVTEYIAQDVPIIPLFLRYGTDNIWEHFDFNLETFSSWTTVISDATTALPYQDFFGQSGSIEILPGALISPTEVNDLMYSPVIATRYGTPPGMREMVPFRLTMFTRGVPQENYLVNQPITVTVPYSLTDLSHVYENTISLFFSDGETFIKAVASCPPELQYELLDTQTDIYTVRVCHLSEFTLAGEEKFLTFLPLTRK
jgi:peptide/nickel transport system substrate-binding protein